MYSGKTRGDGPSSENLEEGSPAATKLAVFVNFAGTFPFSRYSCFAPSSKDISMSAVPPSLTQEEQRIYRRAARDRHEAKKQAGIPVRPYHKLSVPLAHMTPEDLREYQRFASNRAQIKRIAGIYINPGSRELLKVCKGCKKVFPRSAEYFYPRGTQFSPKCRQCYVPPNEKDSLSARAKKELRAFTCCEICGSAARKHIDHCHDTGRIRGILCSNCNIGVGSFDDNPDLLERAAAYLRKTGLHRSGDRRSVKKQKRIAALRKLVAHLQQPSLDPPVVSQFEL
jgi:hypothetical protein